MASRVQFPGGLVADLHGEVWTCEDPTLQAMLRFYGGTERRWMRTAPGKPTSSAAEPDEEEAFARWTAAKFGAKVIPRPRATKPVSVPGRVY